MVCVRKLEGDAWVGGCLCGVSRASMAAVRRRRRRRRDDFGASSHHTLLPYCSTPHLERHPAEARADARDVDVDGKVLGAQAEQVDARA